MNQRQLFLPCAAGVEGYLADEVHSLTGLAGQDLLVGRAGVLTNSAALSSATFDPLGSNNLAAVETVVDPPGGDLQFEIAAVELREDRASVWIAVTRTNRTYGRFRSISRRKTERPWPGATMEPRTGR